MIASVRASSLEIPFRLSFKHASAARAATQTAWVVVEGSSGLKGCGEGCPREYVTGESLADALAFVAEQDAAWRERVRDVGTLAAWSTEQRALVDRHPAAWSAFELACLDLLARTRGSPVETLLGMPQLGGRFRYTAVIGDSPAREFDTWLARYRAQGFRDFKIKLSGDAARDAAKVRSLEAAGISPAAVRADANNLWASAEAAITHLRGLRFPFAALEEPVRAADYAGMARVAEALDCRIVADESVARSAQLADLQGPPERWVINVRVSKMGGLLRSLQVVEEARSRGLRVIVGAHVGETSVLTRAGMTVARAAGDALVAHEGAFGTHLLERDVCDPPLQFGAGGVIDIDATGIGKAPGWGLAMRQLQ